MVIPLRNREVLLQLVLINGLPWIAALKACHNWTPLTFFSTPVALAASYFIWFSFLYGAQTKEIFHDLLVKIDNFGLFDSQRKHVIIAWRIAVYTFLACVCFRYPYARILISGYLSAICVHQGSGRGISIIATDISSIGGDQYNAQSKKEDSPTDIKRQLDLDVLPSPDDEVGLAWYRGEAQSGIRHTGGLNRRRREGHRGFEAGLMTSTSIRDARNGRGRKVGTHSHCNDISPPAVASSVIGSYRPSYRAEVARSSQKQYQRREEDDRPRQGLQRHRQHEYIYADTSVPEASRHAFKGGEDYDELSQSDRERGAERVGKRKLPDANNDHDEDEDTIDAGTASGGRSQPRRKRINASRGVSDDRSFVVVEGSKNRGSFWNQMFGGLLWSYGDDSGSGAGDTNKRGRETSHYDNDDAEAHRQIATEEEEDDSSSMVQATDEYHHVDDALENVEDGSGSGSGVDGRGSSKRVRVAFQDSSETSAAPFSTQQTRQADDGAKRSSLKRPLTSASSSSYPTLIVEAPHDSDSDGEVVFVGNKTTRTPLLSSQDQSSAVVPPPKSLQRLVLSSPGTAGSADHESVVLGGGKSADISSASKRPRPHAPPKSRTAMDGVVISESSGMYRSFSFDAEDPVSRGRKSPPSPRYRKSADFSSPEKAFHGNGAEMSPSDENIFDTLSRNRKQALEAAEKMLKDAIPVKASPVVSSSDIANPAAVKFASSGSASASSSSTSFSTGKFSFAASSPKPSESSTPPGDSSTVGSTSTTSGAKKFSFNSTSAASMSGPGSGGSNSSGVASTSDALADASAKPPPKAAPTFSFTATKSMPSETDSSLTGTSAQGSSKETRPATSSFSFNTSKSSSLPNLPTLKKPPPSPSAPAGRKSIDDKSLGIAFTGTGGSSTAVPTTLSFEAPPAQTAAVPTASSTTFKFGGNSGNALSTSAASAGTGSNVSFGGFGSGSNGNTILASAPSFTGGSTSSAGTGQGPFGASTSASLGAGGFDKSSAPNSAPSFGGFGNKAQPTSQSVGTSGGFGGGGLSAGGAKDASSGALKPFSSVSGTIDGMDGSTTNPVSTSRTFSFNGSGSGTSNASFGKPIANSSSFKSAIGSGNGVGSNRAGGGSSVSLSGFANSKPTGPFAGGSVKPSSGGFGGGATSGSFAGGSVKPSSGGFGGGATSGSFAGGSVKPSSGGFSGGATSGSFAGGSVKPSSGGFGGGGSTTSGPFGGDSTSAGSFAGGSVKSSSGGFGGGNVASLGKSGAGMGGGTAPSGGNGFAMGSLGNKQTGERKKLKAKFRAK